MGRKYQVAHFRDGHGRYSSPVDGVKKGAVPAYGTIAVFNRWTRRPHEHTREIARNTMTIAERRAADYND